MRKSTYLRDFYFKLAISIPLTSQFNNWEENLEKPFINKGFFVVGDWVG